MDIYNGVGYYNNNTGEKKKKENKINLQTPFIASSAAAGLLFIHKYLT